MIRSIVPLIFLYCLFHAQAYYLDGLWTLRTSQINQLQGLKIIFDFNTFTNDGHTISQIVTLTTCNLMSYNFSVSDDQIYFDFLKIGRSLRQCQPGELVILRTKLEQIFNFYIMGSTMLMLDAAKRAPLKFDKVIDAIDTKINGVWTITDGVSYSYLQDIRVRVNGTQLHLCGGDTRFKYRIIDSVRIVFTEVAIGKCNADMVNEIKNIQIYKINKMLGPVIVNFYNKDIELVMEMMYIGEQFQNSIILFNINQNVNNDIFMNSTKGETTKNSTNNQSIVVKENDKKNTVVINNQTSIKSNTSNTSTTSIANSSKPTNVTNKNITLSNSNNISNTTLSNNSNNISIANKTNAVLKNTTNNPNNSLTNNSNNNTITNNTNILKNNSQNIAPVVNNTSKLVQNSSQNNNTTSTKIINANDLTNFWYPYHPETLASLAAYASALQSYYLIINPGRILIAGGCNTIFSPYTIANNQLSNLKITSSNNACDTKIDNLLSSIIFNTDNKLSLFANGQIKMLDIYSNEGTKLLTLSTQAPN